MKHDSDILKRIKSYLMRRKSADQAHAFEREAERDAFLYEAMEGFEGMLTSDIQQAMDELDDRLDEQSKRITAPLYFKYGAALVAIGFILTLGLWFAINGTSKPNPEASTETGIKERYQPREGSIVLDSMSQIAMKLDTISAANDSNQNRATATIYKTQTIKVPLSKTTSPLPTSESSSSKLSNESEASANGQELAVANSSAALSAGAETEQAKETAVDQVDTPVAISDSRSREAESTSETKRAKSESLKDKASPSPTSGWALYNSYLKNNLKTSEAMPAGSVGLSFELDRNGKPKKIVVTKSLCTACDAEAIRLVANGPTWKSDTKKAKGSVSVSFP